MSVNPFTINVSDNVLEDLKKRLSLTRWPDEIPGSGWGYGTNLDYLKELVSYWQNDFDWKSQEKKLNELNHFTSQVKGLNIHFVHEKGKGPNSIPIVITHGWPSTFFEMHKIIPRLTDPASYGGDPSDSFDVIAPSLPGYGFSEASKTSGMDVKAVAAIWDELITKELGYPKYAVHGGDIGAGVTANLGYYHHKNTYGIHLTAVTRPMPYLGENSKSLTDAEKDHLNQRLDWEQKEGAYGHMHRTKPQTLSYGLNDSPVGLAGWIVEKYRSWSDCGGDIESKHTKDELLTNIMIYWATGTIGSAVRMYRENNGENNVQWTLAEGDQILAPTAVAIFPHDLSTPPKEWAERSFNLQNWTNMSKGGHFAALEEPDLLVEDIRAFFRTLR